MSVDKESGLPVTQTDTKVTGTVPWSGAEDHEKLYNACQRAQEWADAGIHPKGSNYWMVMFVDRLQEQLPLLRLSLGETAPAVTQEEEHDPWVYLPCGRHNDHSTGCSDCQRVRQSEYILKRQREVAKAICKRPDVTRPAVQGVPLKVFFHGEEKSLIVEPETKISELPELVGWKANGNSNEPEVRDARGTLLDLRRTLGDYGLGRRWSDGGEMLLSPLCIGWRVGAGA